MNRAPFRLWARTPRSPNAYAALLLVGGALVVATTAAINVSAGTAVYESALVSSDRLARHGIELKPVPAMWAGAVVSAENASAKAREWIGATKDPDETYRVLASATFGSPKGTAWLFLFRGGSGPMLGGPPEGVQELTVAFTGVLVDDQTGEIIRWFRGGSKAH